MISVIRVSENPVVPNLLPSLLLSILIQVPVSEYGEDAVVVTEQDAGVGGGDGEVLLVDLSLGTLYDLALLRVAV